MAKTFNILLVEDESFVLMLLEDMLADLGHSVAAKAFDLAEATELARSASYDLAIVDVNLNGQRSFPAAEIVRDRRKLLIFSTGYPVDAIEKPFADAPVLRKPFDQKSLAAALALLA